MIDARTAGHELQGQILAAARKGQQRVTSTVKTMTVTAQHIRPQLTGLPRPDPARLRAAMTTGAHQVAGHARTVQRTVGHQVREVGVPLAKQAATAVAHAGTAIFEAGAKARQARPAAMIRPAAGEPAGQAQEPAEQAEQAGPAKAAPRPAAARKAKGKAKPPTE